VATGFFLAGRSLASAAAAVRESTGQALHSKARRHRNVIALLRNTGVLVHLDAPAFKVLLTHGEQLAATTALYAEQVQ
jgi:hypothetical protein